MYHVDIPGSAAAAFLTLNGMESLLSHQYFQTENKTEMYSDVFTAILPAINNTNLTEPVNFTIQHKKVHHQPKSEDCIYPERHCMCLISVFLAVLEST